MMRYSEISRDLNSDSLHYTELSRKSHEPTTHDYGYAGQNYEHPCYQQQQLSSTAQQLWRCSNGNGNGNANTIAYIRQQAQQTPRQQLAASAKNLMKQELEVKQHVGKHQQQQQPSSKSLNIKSGRRKNSIGCLNSFSSSPDSPGCYYSMAAPVAPASKSQSLPAHSSIKQLDAVIMSALRVPADVLANQITLLDFPVFALIQPDELSSCAWTKKDKHVVTPNIVAFTKRFNHTSFWTVQEILNGEQPKQRAEIMTHFIKVAKKLHELNNLHSLFAIISAMQSASIYRLKKTWACLSKKDRQSFERLSDIFSDQNNWSNLRAYLESLRLPCIPYLGLFLTDLIYIDLAHPHKGGLEPEQRRNKMNNILRVISNYQQSDYKHIVAHEITQKYLTSIRYIEELQNIFEEDQYKRSLNLEPTSPSGPSSSSCSSKESFNVEMLGPALGCLNLSPAKTIGSMRMASGTKFVPGHRKCRSLGTNIFGKIAHTPTTYEVHGHAHHLEHDLSQQPRHHLLDDSVLEHSDALSTADLTSLESAEGILCDFGGSDCDLMSPEAAAAMQGCVRRKTVQKEGRKPAVASWQRYWLQIWANSLVYFPPKSFKGSEREDFKREPCKVCSLDGWMAHVSDNTKHKNTFELHHRHLGTVYKFRTDSPQMTHLWTNAICKLASMRVPKPLPANLMSFE
ncbi:ras-specific guanine nucleotide-releasing factor RalGPS1 isoform X1 [Scaptodrosophila lebanonensis]|uniref:Ras-specific guanine nucleotide-releasing factor RalGPS1 isoform X1 n=1 Tax=Drosophila lebanonensis TaxID=7225 RepID=A0A6J2SYX5_DROLE|nr:ras-specific guanine nucleotide-releasing factor RalGPS1 isoform X1 [Scaptodrosophila lebanonensis]XP_030369132.1 ras-specific guanine nucleotide-releasing factor RalGPS1 isoform X1 [Scaptodrosophila lebanonensis]